MPLGFVPASGAAVNRHSTVFPQPGAILPWRFDRPLGGLAAPSTALRQVRILTERLRPLYKLGVSARRGHRHILNGISPDFKGLFLKRPRYSPPYDSPIEDDFAHAIVKWLHPSAIWIPQLSVNTPWGQFRLDFYLEVNEKKIGFECDGRDFHQRTWWRDRWRDQMILGSGIVDVIYRFRGCDIFHRLDDCLYLASLWDPEVFSERGRLNLETLANFDVLGERHKGREEVELYYRDCGENGESADPRLDGSIRELTNFYIRVVRRCLETSNNLFNYANARRGQRLESVMSQYLQDYAPRDPSLLHHQSY